MKTITGPLPKSSPHLSHLAHPALQQVVGWAALDPSLCARLLNGNRAKFLDTGHFGLSADERAFLMTIRADTLTEFARAISTRYSHNGGG